MASLRFGGGFRASMTIDIPFSKRIGECGFHETSNAAQHVQNTDIKPPRQSIPLIPFFITRNPTSSLFSPVTNVKCIYKKRLDGGGGEGEGEER